ncbi:MAG: family ATPase [Chloroflexi bacterium]|nr:family ATPase [Chloroflexota bacterium]
MGRGAELAHLRAILGDIAPGAGRTVVVGGEAGIGKSRLLGRLADIASADGATVLEGACLGSADDGIPYAPFVEILRELVRATPPERLPALLGPSRAELARLVPDLITRAADVPAPSELDRGAQARLFELILGVFERLAATTTLVVVIEDIHWADRSTRDLLGFLVRALRDSRVLILLTMRTDERGDAVGNLAFVAELEREEQVDRLDVHAFGREDVEAQIEALLDAAPEPSAVDRLLARSDGNPFYVEELVLAGGEVERDLPPVLRDVLAARIGSLTEPARNVLRAAAAAGRRIDDELLAAVLDLPVRALGDALRESVASGVLVRREQRDGPMVEFRHALLQEVVSAELFPAERLALHAAFAAALEARAAAGSITAPAEIARHWDAARRPDRALSPTILAAQAAEQVYAFGEAQRLWTRAEALARAAPDAAAALAIAPDVLLGSAADSAVLAGSYRDAVTLGQAALRAVDADADPARAGDLHDRLRWYLWEAGDRPAAAAAVEAALRLIPSDVPSVARARALGQHAGILLFAGSYEAAADEARAAIEIALAADAPGEAALALGVLGWSLAVLGDPEAGLARFREGMAIAERLESVEGMALSALNLTSLLDRIGRTTESLETAATGYATTERLGVARTYGGLLLGFRAKAEFLLGRWDAADASTVSGLARGATDRPELWLSVNRARLLTARGAWTDAGSLLRRARAIEERLGGTEFLTPLLAAESELAAWEGRLEDVRRAGQRGFELASRPGPPDPSLAWLGATLLRAEADAVERRSGRRSALSSNRNTADEGVAAIVAGIDRAIQAAMGGSVEMLAGSGRGRALFVLFSAERSRLLGHDEAANWDRAAQAWTAADRPYPAAYARFREAAATLAAGGPRTKAAEALGAAARTGRALGAVPLVRLVEALARQARITLDGATDGRGAGERGGAGTAGTAAALRLTSREMEVLRLVAGGWTNQQIAEALFITRKTASVHVSNILGKLGVEHRGAAAAAAHRLGLAADTPAPPDST